MILSDVQIEYIANNLEHYGVHETELREDLLDHICTHIEEGESTDFELAYRDALQKFGGQYGVFALQQHTFYLVSLQQSQTRRKVLYIAGFIAAFFISSGSIFKFMHWPWASIMLVAGFTVLNLIFLPVFFYHRYKRENHTYSSIF
jgi:hypothetical protein